MVHPFLFLQWIAEKLHLHVGDHVLYTWLVMAILIVLSVIATRGMKLVPTGFQNFFEPIIVMIEDMMEEIMGPKGKTYFPLIATIAFFILTCNLIALIPGFYPPTASLNTNAAMALTVFVMTHIIGVKEHGMSYIKHFTGPIWWMAPLMLPIEIIGHMARPLSLTLRLFGNMYGHEIVIMVFIFMAPLIVPVPIMIMGVLVAFIQTYVFMLLSMIYIAGALEEAH
ncbi:MAG: ATP synthase F0 subunit A [Desulfuromonas sp.]|nr:MAG: ATP synthase F0 subunit A [Desulfuromonas sp.]